MPMDRREVLKYTALLTGAAVSAPLASVVLSGCNARPAENAGTGSPAFFTPEEFALLTTIVDLILPQTDSPSASGVGVHHTIDSMVGGVYKEEDKATFRKEFDALAGYLNEEAFSGLEPSQQLNLLQQLEKPEEEKWEEARDAFLGLKQQTIAYYLSTREIATRYLTYLPVPGTYKACISVEEAGGKAWAL